MHYHRADGRLRMPFYKHPGKYGLFVFHRDELARRGPTDPINMVTSANNVAVLVSDRQYYKPVSRGYVAVIARSVRIPEFDNASLGGQDNEETTNVRRIAK